MDSIRSTLKRSLGCRVLGRVWKLRNSFSSLPPAFTKICAISFVLHTLNQSLLSYSWVTSSHLFLSDAIIPANVMRGWLSFWRFLSSLFLLDWHDNKYLLPICRASVPIASFYGPLLIFSWEQRSREARELKFGSSSVFFGWQQEIHPNSVVWVLNLSSYRVYQVKQSLTIFSAASHRLCWINTSSAI